MRKMETCWRHNLLHQRGPFILHINIFINIYIYMYIHPYIYTSSSRSFSQELTADRWTRASVCPQEDAVSAVQPPADSRTSPSALLNPLLPPASRARSALADRAARPRCWRSAGAQKILMFRLCLKGLNVRDLFLVTAGSKQGIFIAFSDVVIVNLLY